MTPIELIRSCLPDVRENGDTWSAKCPAHHDRKASLSVSRGDDGRVLLHCHAGCTPVAVCEAMGLRLGDLFPPSNNGDGLGRVIATYDYHDAKGTLLSQVLRYKGKNFRQRRPDGNGGWIWKLERTPRVLYCLPDLIAAPRDAWVHVVEGEKDADNLSQRGAVATTCPQGAGKWSRLSDDSALDGRRVAVIADKDARGRAHAEDVAQRLYGRVADLRVLELPGEGKDASDWLAVGGTVEQLRELVEAAPPYSPPAETSAEPHRLRGDERPSILIDNNEHRVTCETITALAGAMRRVGMSQAEIFAALQQANADRCMPPLPLREVERIAASIARYEPNAVSAALAENHWALDRAPPAKPGPLSVRELMAKHRTLRAPVICGLLRRGETMNVIAPPKTGKSWLVLALAMCVATGRRWLDTFETVAGDVLIIDNELHAETLAHRIPQVAECLRIGMNEIAETLSVHSLRGQLRDIYSLAQYFEAVESGRFALVVLDAFYRFMPRGMDENDNGTMANIYNHVDALANRQGCSFVLIHHSTKGNQSTKAVTDVGAGAGSQSRATDTHLVMRPHEERGAVVLDAAVRSWPPIEPIALRWLFPLWKPAPDLDPSALRGTKSTRRNEGNKRDEPRAPEWTVERFVEVFISDEPASKAEIREVAKDEPGLSWRRVSDLIDIAESQGMIHRWRIGRAHRVLYATVPQSAAEETGS